MDYINHNFISCVGCKKKKKNFKSCKGKKKKKKKASIKSW